MLILSTLVVLIAAALALNALLALIALMYSPFAKGRAYGTDSGATVTSRGVPEWQVREDYARRCAAQRAAGETPSSYDF